MRLYRFQKLFSIKTVAKVVHQKGFDKKHFTNNVLKL